MVLVVYGPDLIPPKVDHGTIEITDPALNSYVALTAADKRYMEEMTKSVLATWSSDGGM